MLKIAIDETVTVKELLKRIEKGEACILTEEGKPVAEVFSL
jgi:antitoxin (DNA-binding transcriptional repressor) of toxin-antitoxin stability system